MDVVPVVVGAVGVSLVLDVEVDAALAIAAPPPTSAPVTASIVSTGLIRFGLIGSPPLRCLE